MIATLEPHPETPNDAVERLTVRVSRASGGMLAAAYVLEGDLGSLRIPERRPAGAENRLWEHTCFEIFIRISGVRLDFCASTPDAAVAAKIESDPTYSYHELNFAPYGTWAAYAFERYRAGAAFVEPLEPQVTVRRAEGKLELDALIPLTRLSPTYVRASLSLGVSAVIEDSGGALSYWALAHPPGQPDFHHPHAFALTLE